VYSIIIIMGVVGNLAILIAFIGNKVCGSILGMNKLILDYKFIFPGLKNW
jgi:hypothetical protein